MLLHTHLGASVSNLASASDASGTGRAVGAASALTSAGEDFASCTLSEGHGPVKAPLLVVSLFNGIGGAFRAYGRASRAYRLRHFQAGEQGLLQALAACRAVWGCERD